MTPEGQQWLWGKVRDEESGALGPTKRQVPSYCWLAAAVESGCRLAALDVPAFAAAQRSPTDERGQEASVCTCWVAI